MKIPAFCIQYFRYCHYQLYFQFSANIDNRFDIGITDLSFVPGAATRASDMILEISFIKTLPTATA